MCNKRYLCVYSGQVSRLSRDRKYPKAKRRLRSQWLWESIFVTLFTALIKFYVFYVLFNFRYVKAHVFQSELVFRRFPQTDNKMKSYPWYASNVRLDVLFVLHCSSFLNFRFPQIVVLKPPLTLIFPTKGWCPGARHWLLPTRAWMAYNVCCNQPAQSGYNWIKLDFLGPRRPEPKLWGVQQPGRRGQGTGEQREDR